MRNNNFPEIDEILINTLKEIYPDKLPSKEISSYEMGYLIGQQSIIKKLEAEFREQNP